MPVNTNNNTSVIIIFFLFQQIQYLREYDTPLSRQILLCIKNHRRKGWSSKHSEQTFQPFNQLNKLYTMLSYAACLY